MSMYNLRIRLLRKSLKRKSGYEIVGYMITDQTEYGLFQRYSWTNEPFPRIGRYDAFELGIKLGDEWFYEGDRIRQDETGSVGTINYDKFEWFIGWDNEDDPTWDDYYTPLTIFADDTPVNFTRIGTIHDEEDG